MTNDTVVVTRHPALVAYLAAEGIAPAECAVVTHATPDDVRDKRVIGVLPLHLAAEAAEVVEVPMNIPAELRGVELTLEQVREFAGKPVSYVVVRAHGVAPSCETCSRERRRGWPRMDINLDPLSAPQPAFAPNPPLKLNGWHWAGAGAIVAGIVGLFWWPWSAIAGLAVAWVASLVATKQEREA